MKNGSYYGIDFGTTNTSVYLYNYEQGKGSREAGYGTDGKDLTPFSSCIAISKTVKNDFKFGREVREKINEYADTANACRHGVRVVHGGGEAGVHAQAAIDAVDHIYI